MNCSPGFGSMVFGRKALNKSFKGSDKTQGLKDKSKVFTKKYCLVQSNGLREKRNWSNIVRTGQ